MGGSPEDDRFDIITAKLSAGHIMPRYLAKTGSTMITAYGFRLDYLPGVMPIPI